MDDGEQERPNRATQCFDCLKLFAGKTAQQNADGCREHQERGLCPK